jgi:hypothetical protein
VDRVFILVQALVAKHCIVQPTNNPPTSHACAPTECFTRYLVPTPSTETELVVLRTTAVSMEGREGEMAAICIP